MSARSSQCGHHRGGARTPALLLLSAAALASLQGLSRAFLVPSPARGSGVVGVVGAVGRAQRTGVARAAESLSAGDAVEALFEDGQMYPATVLKQNKDGSFEVKWDNPDGGPETSVVAADGVKKYVPPIPLDQLKVGQKMSGKVTGTAPFGAFVNIGAEKDGMVHVSCLKDGFVSSVDEVVQVGQEVEVWVKGVTDGKVSLTMVESKLQGGGGGRPARAPADVSGFSEGEQLTGKVVSVTNFGAFVSVQPSNGGAAQQGLVHVSQLSDGYVQDPNDVVQVGQEVTVSVLRVDRDANKLSLSMKSQG